VNQPSEPCLPEGFRWVYLLGTRSRRADGTMSPWRFEDVHAEPRRRRTYASAVRAAELFNHRSVDEEQCVFRLAVTDSGPLPVEEYRPEVTFGADPSWTDEPR
jgi:hypothetical protein